MIEVLRCLHWQFGEEDLENVVECGDNDWNDKGDRFDFKSHFRECHVLFTIRIDTDLLFLSRGLHSHENEDNNETDNE